MHFSILFIECIYRSFYIWTKSFNKSQHYCLNNHSLVFFFILFPNFHLVFLFIFRLFSYFHLAFVRPADDFYLFHYVLSNIKCFAFFTLRRLQFSECAWCVLSILFVGDFIVYAVVRAHFQLDDSKVWFNNRWR